MNRLLAAVRNTHRLARCASELGRPSGKVGQHTEEKFDNKKGSEGAGTFDHDEV